MNLIRENIVFLQAVATLPKKQVKVLLEQCSKDQIRALGEVAKNVLNHNLTLPLPYKLILKKQRRVIRAIGEDTVTHKERLHIITTKSDTVSKLVKGVLDKLKLLIKK